MSSDLSPRLLGAYRRTRYEAGGVAVRVGRRSGDADRLLERLGAGAAGFVTAWNPRSRRKPAGWNRRMQRALLAAAWRLPHAVGRGFERGKGWCEEHVLIAADPRRLLVLARRFRQRGIVVIASGRPARLLLLA